MEFTVGGGRGKGGCSRFLLQSWGLGLEELRVYLECISGIFYVVPRMNSGPYGYIAIILPTKPSPQPLPGFSQESFS